MPNGKVHTAACVVTALSSAIALPILGASLGLTLKMTSGALVGILISPDLDLMENGNYSMVILRKWSNLLAEIWRLFWWPYAKMSHHRGYSHWPVIGTLVRVIYMLIPVIIITYILTLFRINVSLNLSWLIPSILGLMLADYIHVMLDAIF